MTWTPFICASETRRCHAEGDSASARRDPRASPRSQRIRLSRMVRFQSRQCRAQRVLGAYRHVGLHLLERREHAATTSQPGFRNLQPTGRRGCDRPRSATPPRGGRGGVPPRRPEGHVVPVAVPVISRGSAGTKGLPGGAVSPLHTGRRPELHRTAAAQRLVTSRCCPAAMNPKAPCPAEVRLRYGVTPEDAGPGLVPGMCASPAHDRNLGFGGRRVPVSRQWASKTLTEHGADRREVVAQLLAAAASKPQTRTGSPPTAPCLMAAPGSCGPTPPPTRPPTSPSSPPHSGKPTPGGRSTRRPRPSPPNAAHHLWTPTRQPSTQN